MRIFITGATGYIGFSVAKALRRAGHDVFGLCRSEAKAHRLAKEEIHPVVGDIVKPETYGSIASACTVLVHAAFDAEGGVVGPDKAVVDAFEFAALAGARTKTVIFTSGVWVLGDTGGSAADETAPLNPLKISAWRPAHEERVAASSAFKGIVVRPGCVYGGRGGMTGEWFADTPLVIGDGSNRWAMVHVEDLADLYVRAAESSLWGEVLHATDRSRSTVAEMATAASRAAGGSGKPAFVPLSEATKNIGYYAEALAVNQQVDSRKAERLLGWHPKHVGFFDEAATYYEAWKASKG